MNKVIAKVLNRNAAYQLNLAWMAFLGHIPFARFIVRLLFCHKTPDLEKEAFGIRFRSPLGLGQGLDRNAKLFHLLPDYGYSFVQVGAANSKNINDILRRLENHDSKSPVILGINADHVRTFSLAYDFADIFCFDVNPEELCDIMDAILDVRLTYDTYKPVLVTIPRIMQPSELEPLLNYCRYNGVDGVEVGGLENVRKVSELTQGRLPIVGYGGIKTADDVTNMLEAGACLTQITTAFLLSGPVICSKITRKLNIK